MCDSQPITSPQQAVALLESALGYLCSFDAASQPTGVQAEVLKGLERAASRQTAARARVLTAFTAQRGHEDDGQATAGAWLKWQTRTTPAAAGQAVGWARRLAARPVVERALADGAVSVSWARQLCDWSDRLPAPIQPQADAILVRAAAAGVAFSDLAGLAEQIYARCASPDAGDRAFEDRYLRLGLTLGGAGRADGDLTPGCAAALSAVLDALGKKAGPEDTRTAPQRRHDALEEACRRLIAAGMVPDRAGQPTHLHVHMSLGQLRALPGAAQAEAAWAAARASQPGWLTGPDAEAAACDATLIPIVTGHVDQHTLDHLTAAHLGGHRAAATASHPAARHTTSGHAGRPTATLSPALPRAPLSPGFRARLRRTLLTRAADTLSGPGGLAAALRQHLLAGTPLASVSLPLDVGAATEAIPAHLRRAVTTRHRHCAFPGCAQPASACQIHHLIPRSRGGPTTLANLVALCAFHHLIAVHRWGWHLHLHPDGTTTATSPNRKHTLHSHSPPSQAA
jgi:Domain of unknown function (DUF222)/HNH endonuclease